MPFSSLGLSAPLLSAIARAGYTAPRPIQSEAIPAVLAGIAAGWAMDLGKEVLTTGMKTFGIDLVDPAELIPQLAKKSQPAKKPAIARK